jgi:hypothetical protein
MNLPSLIAALLPFEYREQVLGDLQERIACAGNYRRSKPDQWI